LNDGKVPCVLGEQKQCKC